MTKLFSSVILIIGLISCQSSTSVEQESSEPLRSFDLNSIKDTADLLFSKIGKVVQIVPLKTVPDAFIGDGNDTYVVSDNHIIIKSKNRLLQFGCDGSVKRILSQKGKGPGISSKRRNDSRNIRKFIFHPINPPGNNDVFLFCIFTLHL
ncbi:MAG: hypothetical protein J7L96_11285 [Bacteroidales bacterium]|nr:hypothetical protein [Bacteroidales bacterium]